MRNLFAIRPDSYKQFEAERNTWSCIRLDKGHTFSPFSILVDSNLSAYCIQNGHILTNENAGWTLNKSKPKVH